MAGWLRPVAGSEGSLTGTRQRCKSEKVGACLFTYHSLYNGPSTPGTVPGPGYCMGHKTKEYNDVMCAGSALTPAKPMFLSACDTVMATVHVNFI